MQVFTPSANPQSLRLHTSRRITLESPSNVWFGIGCNYLASLTPRIHSHLHFYVVILTFNQYITFTMTAIVVYSIESDCVHPLPSLSSKQAHFALLNDLGRHGRRAIGQNRFRQRLNVKRQSIRDPPSSLEEVLHIQPIEPLLWQGLRRACRCVLQSIW